MCFLRGGWDKCQKVFQVSCLSEICPTMLKSKVILPSLTLWKFCAVLSHAPSCVLPNSVHLLVIESALNTSDIRAKCLAVKWSVVQYSSKYISQFSWLTTTQNQVFSCMSRVVFSFLYFSSSFRKKKCSSLTRASLTKFSFKSILQSECHCPKLQLHMKQKLIFVHQEKNKGNLKGCRHVSWYIYFSPFILHFLLLNLSLTNIRTAMHTFFSVCKLFSEYPV